MIPVGLDAKRDEQNGGNRVQEGEQEGCLEWSGQATPVGPTGENTNDPASQHAEDDLNWAFIVMKLSVGDNTYDCSTDGTEECSIGQDGDDNAVWETGEFLILSESGTDIADGATNIDMYVTYRGTAVAGTDDVTVS